MESCPVVLIVDSGGDLGGLVLHTGLHAGYRCGGLMFNRLSLCNREPNRIAAVHIGELSTLEYVIPRQQLEG